MLTKFLISLSFLLSTVMGQVVWVPSVLINSGSVKNFTDGDGNVWSRDRFYRNSAAFQQNYTIANTANQKIYQTYRADTDAALPNMLYKIPVADGEKKIVLHWAELEKTAVGQRIFHVRIGTQVVLRNFDVYKAAGGDKTAITQEFYANVTGGLLNLMFLPKTDLPFISAVAVYSKQEEQPHVLLAQPKLTIVDPVPKKAQGSISIPEGSPWCGGRPAYWWIGHDNTPETPRCQQPDGTWTAPQIAKLDTNDTLNAVDGPTNIDRHDCTTLDMNGDGVLDLACVVGANKGKGNGFNEIYITQPDGSVQKVLNNDLQKYPTMRTRMAATVTAPDGGKLVMIANEGIPRTDGQPNEHRMFRLVSNATASDPAPHFEEVMEVGGPWIQTFEISCLEVFDLNNDGIDDLIMCDQDGPAQFMIQKPDLSWVGIDLNSTGLTGLAWNDARVADVTGDGVPDLIAAGPYRPGKPDRDAPFVRVFKGDPSLPLLFDFASPYYEYRPGVEAMDVEVLDLNKDGILDIYVVLMDRTVPGSYCAQQTGDATPGLDTTHDYVLVGTSNATAPYQPVEMLFEQPGCAGMVKKWGNHSLMVVEAILSHQGVSLLLEW